MFYFVFFTKRSISAMSQVGLFHFSPHTWEAALNNRSRSTLAQGVDRYARATSASAGKQLLFVRQWRYTNGYSLLGICFYVFVVLVDCLPHKLHVGKWLQCSVHAGTLLEKSARIIWKTVADCALLAKTHPVPMYGQSTGASLILLLFL